MSQQPYAFSQAPSPCPRLSYSIDEASAAIGVGRTTLYELIKVGKLRAIKVGKRTLIRHDDLDRLVSAPGPFDGVPHSS